MGGAGREGGFARQVEKESKNANHCVQQQEIVEPVGCTVAYG